MTSDFGNGAFLMQIAMFDLVSDNMLRFACKMFPDNQFFHELLLTRE